MTWQGKRRKQLPGEFRVEGNRDCYVELQVVLVDDPKPTERDLRRRCAVVREQLTDDGYCVGDVKADVSYTFTGGGPAMAALVRVQAWPI